MPRHTNIILFFKTYQKLTSAQNSSYLILIVENSLQLTSNYKSQFKKILPIKMPKNLNLELELTLDITFIMN